MKTKKNISIVLTVITVMVLMAGCKSLKVPDEKLKTPEYLGKSLDDLIVLHFPKDKKIEDGGYTLSSGRITERKFVIREGGENSLIISAFINRQKGQTIFQLNENDTDAKLMDVENGDYTITLRAGREDNESFGVRLSKEDKKLFKYVCEHYELLNQPGIYEVIAGEYESAGMNSSTYKLTITEDGKFKLSDIGAGNPAINGEISYHEPLTKNSWKITVDCFDDEDLDENNPFGFSKKEDNACEIQVTESSLKLKANDNTYDFTKAQ